MSPLNTTEREFLRTHAPNLLSLSLIERRVTAGEREFRLVCVEGEEDLIYHWEEFEQFPFGLLVWEAAAGLAQVMFGWEVGLRGKRILELGAGVGLAGMAGASLGLNITQTDHLRESPALCRLNALRNGVPVPAFFQGDWERWTLSERYDVLIGADILYERSLHEALRGVISASLKPGGTLLLTDPGRAQALEFAAELETQGWRFSLSSRAVSLDGGPAKEVTLYASVRPEVNG